VKPVACLICCAASLVFGAGFRQSLWVKALAIQSGSSRPVVIVATDLVGLPAEVADEVAVRTRWWTIWSTTGNRNRLRRK
jgi:hypothetical protein